MQVLVLIPQRVAGLATNGSKRFLEASIFSAILRFTGAILWRKEICAFLLMKALNILVMRTKNFKIRILCFNMIKKNYWSMILIWLNSMNSFWLISMLILKGHLQIRIISSWILLKLLWEEFLLHSVIMNKVLAMFREWIILLESCFIMQEKSKLFGY